MHDSLIVICCIIAADEDFMANGSLSSGSVPSTLVCSRMIGHQAYSQYPYTHFPMRECKRYPLLKMAFMSDLDFRTVKELVEPDCRGRFSIGAIAKSKSYRVQVNDAGQILLDPVVAIPERELWLWQNPEAIASVQRGLEQAIAGEIHDLGSFTQYADAEMEDG
jgi:hypothetical protein